MTHHRITPPGPRIPASYGFVCGGCNCEWWYRDEQAREYNLLTHKHLCPTNSYPICERYTQPARDPRR